MAEERPPLVTLRPHPEAMAVNPFNYLPRPVKLQRVVTRPPPSALNPFAPSDPFAFTEACVSKGAVSAVAGSVMGALMGLLMGSYQSIQPPVPLPGVPDPPNVPIRWLYVGSRNPVTDVLRAACTKAGKARCAKAGDGAATLAPWAACTRRLSALLKRLAPSTTLSTR